MCLKNNESLFSLAPLVINNNQIIEIFFIKMIIINHNHIIIKTESRLQILPKMYILVQSILLYQYINTVVNTFFLRV